MIRRGKMFDGIAVTSCALCVATTVVWGISGYYFFDHIHRPQHGLVSLVGVGGGYFDLIYLPQNAFPRGMSGFYLRHARPFPTYGWKTMWGAPRGRLDLYLPLWWFVLLFA